MNEILVRLYVPKIGEQYDIWIPIHKKINTIITLLVKSVNDLTKGYYVPKEMPYLYDKTTAKVFDINLRVIESEIRNGTELIMI